MSIIYMSIYKIGSLEQNSLTPIIELVSIELKNLQ
jgi:hypothetical protein